MKAILVVREFDEFSRILAAEGFEVINLPLIETKILENLSHFEESLAAIENFNGIFVTSRHAAQILANQLRRKSIIFGGTVYVLGKRSFEILKDLNLNLFFDEKANTAGEMLESIQLEELKDKHFLFVRGEKSLRVAPDFLAKIASVKESIVYRTEKIAVEIDKINAIGEKIKKNEIAATCFFSPSGAEAFLEQFGADILHQIILAVIGKTTAERLENRKFCVEFISKKSSAKEFATGLIEHLQNGKRKTKSEN